MSYYYTYYLGYKDENGIHPYGPFNRRGKLIPVLVRSRNFSSKLYTLFNPAELNDLSEGLLISLCGKDFIDNLVEADKPYSQEEINEFKRMFPNEEIGKKRSSNDILKDLHIEYLCPKDLPEGDYHITGLISDKDYSEFIMHGTTPEDYLKLTEYAIKAKKSIKNGVEETWEHYDVETGECEQIPISQLNLCTWNDKQSINYEANIIRERIDDFWDYDIPSEQIVIIKTEG